MNLLKSILGAIRNYNHKNKGVIIEWFNQWDKESKCCKCKNEYSGDSIQEVINHEVICYGENVDFEELGNDWNEMVDFFWDICEGVDITAEHSNKEDVAESDSDSDEEEFPYCGLCNSNFVGDREEHDATMYHNMHDICRTSINTEHLQLKIKNDFKMKDYCAKVRKHFDTFEDMINHEINYYGLEKMILLKDNSENFNQKIRNLFQKRWFDLKGHIEVNECSLCKKTFKTKYLLKQHIEGNANVGSKGCSYKSEYQKQKQKKREIAAMRTELLKNLKLNKNNSIFDELIERYLISIKE